VNFLASTQLPKLFGFSGSHGDFWEAGISGGASSAEARH